MRARNMCAGVMCSLLLLAACSNDTTIKSGKTPLTQARLNGALLTEGDFPDKDFKASDIANPAKWELFPDDSCDDGLANLKPDLAAAKRYTSAGGSVVVEQYVRSYPSNGQAQAEFGGFVGACRLVKTTVAGPNAKVSVNPLNFGTLTKDTQTAMVLYDNGGPIKETDFVAAYAGPHLATWILLTGERPTNKGVLDAIVRDAIGKIAFLNQG